MNRKQTAALLALPTLFAGATLFVGSPAGASALACTAGTAGANGTDVHPNGYPGTAGGPATGTGNCAGGAGVLAATGS